nr:aspartate--trna ligase 2, cytoplasmic [Quercus suber]
MDVVDRLFVAMFDSLNNNFAKELEAVGRQYPFEPLKRKSAESLGTNDDDSVSSSSADISKPTLASGTEAVQ